MRALWWWVLGVAVGAVAVAVMGVLSLHDANAARQDLINAKAKLATAASADTTLINDHSLQGADQAVTAALADLDRAHRKVTSPALFFARFVPVLSTQRGGVVALVNDS